MHVEFCTLADHANETIDGRLDVSGISDSLSGRSFPVSVGPKSLVLRLGIEPGDQMYTHSVLVLIEGAEGGRVLEIEGKVPISHDGSSQSSHLNRIFAFRELRFPRPGRYGLRVMIDGTKDRIMPFRVIIQEQDQSGDGQVQ